MAEHAGTQEIQLQVMWTRLMAVVEEQARSLIRTAFSETVSEAGDLSAGVFDRNGRMIAQAVTGTPGHVNSMAEAVRHFVAKFPPDKMVPGDHFITNDPWLSSGHLHDVTVVSPAFHEDRLAGLFACTCHQVDIGGLGQGPDGRSIYEEGLFIPLMRLARGGAINDDLFEMIRANVRQPAQVEGDIRSYMTCNHVGERRLAEMLGEFPGIDLDRLAGFVFDRSERAMREALKELPRGTYRNEMQLDGYDTPVLLKAALTIGEDRVSVDYDGSSPASQRGINLVMNYTKAYTAFGVRAVVAPDVPNNAGSLAPIDIRAPVGSILNVEKPAPVCARHIIGQFLPDVVLGCFAQAVPEKVPAEGASCIWGIQMRGGPEIGTHDGDRRNDRPKSFDVLFFNSGGSGARPTLDGLSATAFPSGVRALPVEAVEHRAPILVRRKELLPDTGGAGLHRGGLAQVVEVGTRDGAPFAVFAMFDRVANPAKGRAGGQPGAPGKVEIVDGARLSAKGKQTVAAGEWLRIELPGAGGFGDPAERDLKLVAADVAAGLVSREAARAHYLVVIDEAGNLDAAATEGLRAGQTSEPQTH